jgi:hypothetical protein
MQPLQGGNSMVPHLCCISSECSDNQGIYSQLSPANVQSMNFFGNYCRHLMKFNNKGHFKKLLVGKVFSYKLRENSEDLCQGYGLNVMCAVDG